MKEAQVRRAKSSPFPVCWRISQAAATFWVNKPDDDRTWLVNHHRKLGTASEPSEPVRPFLMILVEINPVRS